MTADGKTLPAIPAKRYFTIGEVSELCGVKAYVLRYWEQEFTQLKPMKRRGNRRYYQHHEVLLIRRIRDLLYEQGFTISGARNQLHDAGLAHVHAATAARDDEAPAAPGGEDAVQAHADLLAARGDDELDETTLDALAQEDLATIARATREASAAEAASLVDRAQAQSGAGGARGAALSARAPVGSTQVAIGSEPFGSTAQLRAELLAIRALLVG